MKKILFSLMALTATMSLNAQEIEIYNNGRLAQRFTNGKGNNYKVVVEEKREDVKEYVDLGLPSGTLWATCNIGASKPGDYGYFFAWGETQPYHGDISDGRQFDWDDYKWQTEEEKGPSNCTKYTREDHDTGAAWYNNGEYVGSTIDGVTYMKLTTLQPSDDAATANWGSDWCMPTHEQQMELLSNDGQYTTVSMETMDGVYGCKVVSKMPGFEGNYIFLPVVGCRIDSTIYYEGTMSYYWSSSLFTQTYKAWCMRVSNSGSTATGDTNRCYGCNIRAVRAGQTK